eukprot:scpid66470/ scgid22123/ Solute carrier family 35 member F2
METQIELCVSRKRPDAEVILNHCSDQQMSPPERQRPSLCSRAVETVTRVLHNKETWKTIGIGQLLSLFICGTGVTSQLLQTYNFAAPLTQLFTTYFLLGAIFSTSLMYRKDSQELKEILRQRGWKYLVLSVIDVQANFAVVKAYQYTTLTSVQLLDGFSIPCVMLLSRFVLRSRFKLGHYIGVAVCVIGMATLIVTDYFHNYRDEGQDAKSKHSQIIGDLLCLLGAFLYATSNVCEEYLVKRIDVSEFLGMLGFLASFVCGIQILALERSELSDVDWATHGTSVGLLAIGFAIFQLLVYLVMPFAVRQSSAVTINLSLLTADLYSLLFGLFLFSYKFSGLYFLAFILILAGLITYTSFPISTAVSHTVDGPSSPATSSSAVTTASDRSCADENDEHSRDDHGPAGGNASNQTSRQAAELTATAPAVNAAVISSESDVDNDGAGDLQPLIQHPPCS